MKKLLIQGAFLTLLVASSAWADSSTNSAPSAAGASSTAAAPSNGAIDVSGWSFHPGTEFPGATGSMEPSGVGDASAFVLHYNFTGGGVYVAAHGGTNLDKFSELRFSASVKPLDATILVRLVDSSGQFFQKSLNVSGADFQNYKIALSDENWDTIFGGNKSKVIAFPVVEVWLGVNKGTSEPGGDATFKQVTAIK